MRCTPFALCPLALLMALASPLAAPAQAQGARENAETRLNRQLEQDRDRDRAAMARGAAPPGPESMRAMEDDRRSLSPDVGRPEAEGRMEPGGQRGAMTGGMNPQR